MNNPPEDYEDHSAWLASLTPDESLIIHTPVGYLMIFIIVALTKRGLAMEGIKPGEQLDLLEKLHSLTDIHFTPAMLKTIEPMGDLEYQLYCEAASLDPAEDPMLGKASYRLLTSPRVFWHLATLNPSYIAAMRQHEQDWQAAGRLPVPSESAKGEASYGHYAS